MEDYDTLLNVAYDAMPESYFESERFEIPKVKGHLEGNKTVISNFRAIADILGRNPEHILKFLLKELATSGDLKGTRLVFKRKLAASMVNDKIRQYAKQFVLCSKCGKPDTQLVKEKGYAFLKCMACGSKTYVNTKI